MGHPSTSQIRGLGFQRYTTNVGQECPTHTDKLYPGEPANAEAGAERFRLFLLVSG
jgi:hypothetical protein